MFRAVIHVTLKVIAIATTCLLLAMPARGRQVDHTGLVMSSVAPDVNSEHL
jgi:hypothetical protein